jgi:hypothetical protein
LLEVAANVAVGVFGNQQGSAGVAEKQVAKPVLHAACAYRFAELNTDFVKAPPRGGDFQDQ